MSTARRMQRAPHGGRRREAGLSLVELMISMVLGLIVMGAAFAVFMSNQATFRTSEGLGRIQENARVAFELMARDIRAAGGSACSSASMVEDTGARSLEFRGSPVAGNANQLIVRSGDDTAYRVIGSTSTSVEIDPDQLADATDAFETGDFILLCNARKTFVVEATGVAGNVVEFAQLPGAYSPSEDAFAPPDAVVLARYRDVRWFVNDNGRGGTSLYVSRLGGDAEEVAEGVEDLAFQYLDATTGTYQNAPAGLDVTAVRISMTLTGDDADGNELSRTSSHVVSMRSRTL